MLRHISHVPIEAVVMLYHIILMVIHTVFRVDNSIVIFHLLIIKDMIKLYLKDYVYYVIYNIMSLKFLNFDMSSQE